MDYQAWIKQNEPDQSALEEQKSRALSFTNQPLISIVVAVVSPSLTGLHEMLRAILAQSYQNWEVCLVVEKTVTNAMRQALAAYAAQDGRFRVKVLGTNRGIAGNTNAAIEMAQGDFIGFLDQNDCLAPFALYEVVDALNQQPETDLFYSDEDHLSVDGKHRHDPGFKPAFSIDYLRANNYIAHFLVLRKTLGAKIGWMRLGFDGAQDYDLILRAVEQARWITHIPQVLYHARASASSLASPTNSSAGETGLRAVREHLARCGVGATVEQAQSPVIYRVKYEISDNPLVSIIIPNHEHAGDLRRCVNSILTQSMYTDYEILIMENNSRQAETISLYQELQERDARVRVVEYHQQPFNYSEINNHAASLARGSVLLFLNNDTQVITPGWLERMLEYAIRPDVGAVGVRLYFKNLLIQHTGVIVGLGAGAGHFFVGYPRNYAGYRNNLFTPQDLSAVTAACLMMRRSVFDEIGGFGPEYRLAFGDIDLCLKARQKKYLVVCTPYAELIHYESMTRGIEDTREKEARFTEEANLLLERWAGFLAMGDPSYNPNLSLSRGDFSVRAGVCQPAPRPVEGLNMTKRQVS